MGKRCMHAGLILMLVVFLAGNSSASEEEIYESRILPQGFDETVTFGEVEAEILQLIQERHLNIPLHSKAYVDFMYAILYNEVPAISDEVSEYFAAYAAVYVTEYQRREVESPGETGDTESIGMDLDGTIQEERLRNQEKFRKLEEGANQNSILRAEGYNVSAAQDYAKRFALTRNLAYFAYEYDCTNFASQIVHWAGMTPIRTQWQWNRTEQARRCWNVAHDFIEDWTLERGYNGGAYLTKADAKRHALPGDLIGYMDKKDYKIWHVTFVQSKSNGKIYVSQHTRDRYNEDGDGIDINNSTCIIVRF